MLCAKGSSAKFKSTLTKNNKNLLLPIQILKGRRQNNETAFNYSMLSAKIDIKKSWANVLICLQEFKADP